MTTLRQICDPIDALAGCQAEELWNHLRTGETLDVLEAVINNRELHTELIRAALEWSRHLLTPESHRKVVDCAQLIERYLSEPEAVTNVELFYAAMDVHRALKGANSAVAEVALAAASGTSKQALEHIESSFHIADNVVRERNFPPIPYADILHRHIPWSAVEPLVVRMNVEEL